MFEKGFLLGRVVLRLSLPENWSVSNLLYDIDITNIPHNLPAHQLSRSL